MIKVADRFHDKMKLAPEESFKVFLFILKALAAIGFLFSLGQISVTGEISTTLSLIILLSATLDLAPEIYTFRLMKVLPEKARKAEKIQLLLKAVAYLILVSVFSGLATSVFWGYSAFVVLWLASFIVEESVMFLSKAP